MLHYESFPFVSYRFSFQYIMRFVYCTRDILREDTAWNPLDVNYGEDPFYDYALPWLWLLESSSIQL